ncbi:FHA domain-containing protein [Frankia sp. Cas4]|uniref:FHA domain-containing protein n=1 Tax=Frankia sp. Cas4 TaxID=3073927 RepID=UPI002AD24063|nr:FHA domain-containing protein [Frankia sp. Cas4]
MRIVASQEPYVLPPEDGTGSGRQRPRQPAQSAADSYGRRPAEPSGTGPSGTGPSGTGPSGTGPSGTGRSGVDPVDPLGIRRAPDAKRGGAPRPLPGHGGPPGAEPYPRDGYPPEGYAPDGYPPDGYAPERYDANGYPPDGYAPENRHRDGYAQEGHRPNGYAADGYPQDGYAPDGYPPDGYAPDGYAPNGYAPDGYAPNGYSRDAYPPAGYPPGGYDANGYPAAPYRDPRDEPPRDPRDEPRRGEPWGYDRDRADPYAPGHTGPGGGGDDPFGLDRATGAPRGPMPAPPDYHRARPNQPGRVPLDSGDGYGAACPNCQRPNEPGARFCEVCGFDLILRERPAAPVRGAVQTGWDVVVEAEREYYDSGDDHRVPFPTVYPRRVFALSGPRLLIGRRSESRGIHPEIDLSGTPEDPGISRAHAMLELMADGGYAVHDPGSTNGTRLNDEPNPIPPGQPVPLHNGDRVYLGAWTRITIRMISR